MGSAGSRWLRRCGSGDRVPDPPEHGDGQSSAAPPSGVPVHFDRQAFEADHTVVCNRIKPHTHSLARSKAA